MFAGLSKLAEEDYTFSVEKNAETGEILIGGQGETQLEMLAKKVKARYGVDVKLTEPKIAYRETIRSTAEAEGKYKKQTGGHGQYGHCKIRFEPCAEDFVFDEEVVGGAVPKQYFPAVEKGLRESLFSGPLAGCPVTGLKAVLYDGSYHEVDSSEMAFKAAAALAFKEGLKNASPVLLETVYRLKIAVPGDYLGDVMGDINKRRGRIMGTATENDLTGAFGIHGHSLSASGRISFFSSLVGTGFSRERTAWKVLQACTNLRRLSRRFSRFFFSSCFSSASSGFSCV